MKNREEILRRLAAKETYTFDDLRDVMALLRSEGGCPWDLEQTHQSIRACMIEEAYEVVEAIDTENPVLLREELGVVLFQVMFHSRVEEEQGRFCVEDVVSDICAKMIHRHPHVFGSVETDSSEEVLRRWEEIKTEEKQRTTLSSRLRAVPPMLPALMRASKIVKKAEAPAPMQQIEAEELGEQLLNLVRKAVAGGLDAEQCLGQAVERLILAAEEREEQ